METLGRESPSYSTVKKMDSRVKEGERESVEDDRRSGHQKMPPLMKMLGSCTPWCDRRRHLRGVASEEGISFGAVQSILT